MVRDVRPHNSAGLDTSARYLAAMAIAGLSLVACGDGVGEPIRLDTSNLAITDDSSGGAANVVQEGDEGGAATIATTEAVDDAADQTVDTTAPDDTATEPDDAAAAESTADESTTDTAIPDTTADGHDGPPSSTDARDLSQVSPPPDSEFPDGRGGPPPDDGSMMDPNAVTSGAVPSDEEACSSVDTWLVTDTVQEDGMVNAINTGRSLGTPCSPAGEEAMTPFLAMTPRLRCSARLHARDMIERDFFGEINPDGESPEDRITSVGLSFSASVEVIARGNAQAYDIFAQLISDPTTCQELMDPAFTNIGVGFYAGRWVIDLAQLEMTQ